MRRPPGRLRQTYGQAAAQTSQLSRFHLQSQGGDTLLYRVQLSSSTGQNKVNGQLGMFSIVNGQATKFL